MWKNIDVRALVVLQRPNRMNSGGFMKKPVWDKPAPKGRPDKLSPKQKASAKAAAKKAGRPYPNLVDNMRASRKSK